MKHDLEPLRHWLPTLSPQQVREDFALLNAVSALSAAALETRKSLARYKAQGARGVRSDPKLVELWRQASLSLIRVDGALARRCLIKADYWANPSHWTRSRVEEAGIALDDVFDAALNLVSTVTMLQQPQQGRAVVGQNYGEEDLDRVTIGIITALPKEFTAVKRVLGNGNEVVKRGTGSGRRYWVAAVPSTEGGIHIVAVAQLVSMGNNISTARATQFLEHCPNTRVLLMVGIAGGVPNPDKADEHVRLGDIVVSNLMGVIQYDFVKRTESFEQMRHPPRTPMADLLEAMNALESTELEGTRPLDVYIAQAVASLGWARPPLDTDVLRAPRGRKVLAHPNDIDRKQAQPKVFRGPIASANKLLKDPKLRDMLRDQFGVKAVEMEASGVADATWLQDRGYFVVRGICDYCDNGRATCGRNTLQ